MKRLLFTLPKLQWRRYLRDIHQRHQILSTHSLLIELTKRQPSRNTKRKLNKRTLLHFFHQVCTILPCMRYLHNIIFVDILVTRWYIFQSIDYTLSLCVIIIITLSSSSKLMYMVYKGSILLHIDHFHSLVSCSEQQFPHFNSPEANLVHLTNKNVFAIFSCRCRTKQATKHHCFCWVYCY